MLKRTPWQSLYTTLSRPANNSAPFTSTLSFNFSTPMSTSSGTIQTQIESKLSQTFSPSHLEVINESHKHNVPKGSETHFKVVVVSDVFASKPLLEQHRLVNDTLKEELATGVHALSIQTKTPKQWEASGHAVSNTPGCMRPPNVPMK
jgi:stress-induced morphogen